MPEDISNQPADSKPFSLRDVALGALLLFLLLLFYLPAIRGGLVFDDDRLITMEDLRSLHGLWCIWFAPPPMFSYYPLLHTAMWVEHRLWGDAALGYHLVNILLHATAAWLVVAAMRKLSLPGAWLTAFIFALHPVCVESVAWISEQKNTLSTVLYLASALAWLHFDGGRRKRWYLLASGLFLLALLSKTTAGTLPGALLVILWWRKGRLDWKHDVLPLLPWFAMGVALGMISGWIEREGYDTRSSDFTLTFAQHCLLACRELWFYPCKLLWPVNLMFNYPRWQVSTAVWWQWLFPLGVLALAAGLCLLARRTRAPLAAFLFFAGSLFPVMGFFYIGWFMFSYVADHFQYVACLGIIVPLTSGLVLAARKIHAAVLRWAVRAATAVVLVALCSLTWRQSQLYGDMETFYRKTLESNPESGMAHYNYALVLLKIPGHLTEAMGHLEEALRLRPDDVKLKDRIGFMFLNTPGRSQEAVATLEESIKIDPKDSYAHFLLGNALVAMPGRMQDALVHYEESARLNPDVAEVHFMLGNVLAATPGRMQDAIAQYEEGLRLKSDTAEMHYMLANLLAVTPGRLQEAITHYEEALSLKPGFAEAHYMLGNALSSAPGRTREAIVHYEEALRLMPGMIPARERLIKLQQSGSGSGD